MKTSEKVSPKLPIQLATEHWDWLETVLRKIYVDAFIHGYKHGCEDGFRGESRLEERRETQP